MNASLARAAALAAFALCGAPGQAAITDPVDDFLPTFAFPHAGDLDVVSADVIYRLNTQELTFTGTHAAPIDTTSTHAYVFGIDRGAGTVGLPAIADNVTFDSVLILLANGGGSFIDLASGGPPTPVPVPAGSVTIDGSTISATVPASFIPSLGSLDPTQYTWNLWPRSDATVLTDIYVSDFAPDNSNVLVTSVPEPQTWALAALGIAFLGFAVRRR
jgi:PEP-CTERM motif